MLQQQPLLLAILVILVVASSSAAFATVAVGPAAAEKRANPSKCEQMQMQDDFEGYLHPPSHCSERFIPTPPQFEQRPQCCPRSTILFCYATVPIWCNHNLSSPQWGFNELVVFRFLFLWSCRNTYSTLNSRILFIRTPKQGTRNFSETPIRKPCTNPFESNLEPKEEERGWSLFFCHNNNLDPKEPTFFWVL